MDADTDLDPDPDSDWHQNDVNPHAVPTRSCRKVGKSEFFLIFRHRITSSTLHLLGIDTDPAR